MSKLVEFDLDGVLCEELNKVTGSDDYKSCRPLHSGINFFNEFKRRGWFVRINTSRFPEDKRVTQEWLSKYNILYDELVMGKPQADLRIDDRSLNPKYFNMETLFKELFCES